MKFLLLHSSGDERKDERYDTNALSHSSGDERETRA